MIIEEGSSAALVRAHPAHHGYIGWEAKPLRYAVSVRCEPPSAPSAPEETP